MIEFKSKLLGDSIPIQKEYFEKWILSLDTTDKLFVGEQDTYNEQIYERIGYIIKFIWLTMNVKLDGWMFENNNQAYYDENDEYEYYNMIGFFDKETMLNNVGYVIEYPMLTNWRNNTKQIRNGIKYNGKFRNSFPTSWIYTNFEEEFLIHFENWKKNK